MRYHEFAINLFENRQQYRQMLQGMVDADIIPATVADKTSEKIRKLLKRQDRIIWWLKWFRLAATYNHYNKILGYPPRDYDKEDQIRSSFEKITKTKWDDATGKGYDDLSFWNRYLGLDSANLEHISGMFEQIPQLEQFQWNITLTPRQLITDIREIERKWQQSRQQWVSPQEGDKIIKSYNNGEQAWILLDRGACSDEGSAMGHCGNVPSQRPGDRIISFRTIKGEEQKPHLTFILHKNGFLGEMKGRANEKPQPKYHPYIIDLLKNPMIKGITGGGYAPDENFELTDLPEQQMEALLDLKPTLGGPLLAFKRNNFKYNQEIGEMLEPLIDDYLTYVDFDKPSGNIIIETYDSISEIGKEYDDNTLEYVGDILSGERMLDVYTENMIDEKNTINDIYTELSDETKQKLQDYIQKSDDVEEENRDDVIDALMDLIENDSSIRDAFESGIISGVEVGTESDMYDNVYNHLASNGFVEINDENSISLSERRKKDQWMLTTHARTVLNHMIYEGKDDLDYVEWKDIIELTKMDEPYYGWSGWDEKSAAERTEDELYNIL